jgi:hypothetical protein
MFLCDFDIYCESSVCGMDSLQGIYIMFLCEIVIFIFVSSVRGKGRMQGVYRVCV